LVAIVYSHVRSELRPSKRAMAAPRAQQRVLHGVLGVVDRAEHAVAVGVEQPAVGSTAGRRRPRRRAGGVEQLALGHARPIRRAGLGLPEGDLAARRASPPRCASPPALARLEQHARRRAGRRGR
jgi:hypothetical protein